jgi:hypothetical protein
LVYKAINVVNSFLEPAGQKHFGTSKMRTFTQALPIFKLTAKLMA